MIDDDIKAVHRLFSRDDPLKPNDSKPTPSFNTNGLPSRNDTYENATKTPPLYMSEFTPR